MCVFRGCKALNVFCDCKKKKISGFIIRLNAFCSAWRNGTGMYSYIFLEKENYFRDLRYRVLFH